MNDFWVFDLNAHIWMKMSINNPNSVSNVAFHQVSGLEDGQPHNHRYTPTNVKAAQSPYKIIMMMMMPAAILCGTTTPTGNRPLRRCRPQNSATAATFER